MLKLENLVVGWDRYHSPARVIKYEKLWRGTWDWSFPCLRWLHIGIDPWLADVRFDFLKKCPRLQCISFYYKSFEGTQSLKVLPEPTTAKTTTAATETIVDADTIDRLPSVRSFILEGRWAIEKNELAYLYNHMLPGLEYFYLGDRVTLVDCNDEDFVQITKTHSRCNEICVPSLRKTSSLKRFGFSGEEQDKSIYYQFMDDKGYCMREP
ncbi:hypothetical protein BGW42_004527 [Actinomortierella wolfii]|nr:hypothetical protein BGW42_004527 [Actinomortierella wolfii]